MNDLGEEDSPLTAIFSRKMKLGGVGATPVQRRIEADAGENIALAKVFGLPEIARLAGDFTLVCSRGGIIDVTLALTARVTQICVLTLEPFDAKVTETAKLRFIPAAALREDAEIAALDPDSLEGPDELPYRGDIIDLGAALAEQLALALDPYPRKPGAKLPPAATDGSAHPFAALAARKGLPANDPE
jgi:hypothetical protein